MSTRFRNWLIGARPYPYARETTAFAMASLYLVGGLTTLGVLILPHPSTLNVGVMLVIGGAAPLVALAIGLLRNHLPPRAYPWLLAIGTGIITTLVATGGSTTASVTFSFFYLWIVMYSLLFFSPIITIVQLATAAAAYGTVLTWQASDGTAFTAFEPLVLVSVLATTSMVVTVLSRARETTEIDPLTRVANRRGLDRALEIAVKSARATSRPLMVAIIDIDDFKSINDEQGHAVGDQTLVALVEAWRPIVRADDLIGRFGGDEFVVVLPSCSPADAEATLERLRVAAPTGITCSIGAAQWQTGESVSMVLRKADGALYEAKRRGRDCIVWGAAA